MNLWRRRAPNERLLLAARYLESNCGWARGEFFFLHPSIRPFGLRRSRTAGVRQPRDPACAIDYLSSMTPSVNLPTDAERRLAEVAKRPNVPVQDLAAAAIRDLLAEPTEEFERVARRVLEKNRELYRRLA